MDFARRVLTVPGSPELGKNSKNIQNKIPIGRFSGDLNHFAKLFVTISHEISYRKGLRDGGLFDRDFSIGINPKSVLSSC